MKGAPMFNNAWTFGPPCNACNAAGRVLVVFGTAAKILTRIITVAGKTWQACPVCDQNPADAPTWTHQKRGRT